MLFVAVCGTIADCDDYEAIADWGEENLDFLRRFLPFHHGVPTGRWLTILMNRLNPALFSACFTAWVRETWPERRDVVAIDGKTSRRSHDRAAEMAPLHLVSAFATTRRLVLGQEAVRDKSNELTAIPALLERLARDGGLEGALVTIDAMGCNAAIAQAVRSAGADYLIAVKANQPTLMAEFDLFFGDAEKGALDRDVDVDKGHGRIETRRVEVARQAEWARRRTAVSREFRMPGGRRRPGPKPRRVEGSQPLRDPLLYRLPAAFRRMRRQGDARPLGHREWAALGARRRFPRRPVPAAQGPRRSQHGRRPPLRLQPRPVRPGAGATAPRPR